jgi:hypothetical protein
MAKIQQLLRLGNGQPPFFTSLRRRDFRGHANQEVLDANPLVAGVELEWRPDRAQELSLYARFFLDFTQRC